MGRPRSGSTWDEISQITSSHCSLGIVGPSQRPPSQCLHAKRKGLNASQQESLQVVDSSRLTRLPAIVTGSPASSLSLHLLFPFPSLLPLSKSHQRVVYTIILYTILLLLSCTPLACTPISISHFFKETVICTRNE